MNHKGGMNTAKSTTKEASNIVDNIVGTSHFETKITESDGSSVTGYGHTSEQSQKDASKKR